MNTVQFGVRAPQFSNKSGQRPKFQAQQPVHFGAEPKNAQPSRTRPMLVLTALLGLVGAGVTAVTDNPVSRMFKSEEALAAQCSHKESANSATIGFGPTPFTYSYNFGKLSTLNMFPETRDQKRIGVRLSLNCDCLAENKPGEAFTGTEAESKAKDELLKQNVETAARLMTDLLERYVPMRLHADISEEQLTEAIMPRLREQLAERGIDVDGVLSLKVDMDPKEAKEAQ